VGSSGLDALAEPERNTAVVALTTHVHQSSEISRYQ